MTWMAFTFNGVLELVCFGFIGSVWLQFSGGFGGLGLWVRV